MAKPVILVVEPSPEVLRAIKGDLRRQYEDRLRVLRVDSDTTGLETLKQLQECNESVTLFVVEQQRSQMTGMEFLKAARKLFPKAKRVFLTVYDTDNASIRVPLQKVLVLNGYTNLVLP
jgi:thioredoxin reductase (NADPH)